MLMGEVKIETYAQFFHRLFIYGCLLKIIHLQFSGKYWKKEKLKWKTNKTAERKKLFENPFGMEGTYVQAHMDRRSYIYIYTKNSPKHLSEKNEKKRN